MAVADNFMEHFSELEVQICFCIGCYHQSAGCVFIIILISCWQKDDVR